MNRYHVQLNTQLKHYMKYTTYLIKTHLDEYIFLYFIRFKSYVRLRKKNAGYVIFLNFERMFSRKIMTVKSALK